MQKALILTIPEHIAALPEAEQGPALVAEIHERKAARMLPFKESRMFYVGGRGYGKVAAQREWLERQRLSVDKRGEAVG